MVRTLFLVWSHSFFLAALGISGFASTVVLVVKDNQIVVAADAKLMLMTKDGKLVASRKPACKIHRANNSVYWTSVGLQTFDIGKYIPEAAASGSLLEQADRFVSIRAGTAPAFS
jgi:hypothetical protein